MVTDSEHYLAKKQALAKTLTIFGRKPVQEAMEDRSLRAQKLHLASTNQNSELIAKLLALAEQRQVPVQRHANRESLARISKNGKQDQGVALDIECPEFDTFESFYADMPERFFLLALDKVTNPQNLGMIVRSVCASPATGLLLPAKGCAKLDSLVIKASAGTLFKTRIIRCQTLGEVLTQLARARTDILGLAAEATEFWPHLKPRPRSVFVLGNESNGLSPEVRACCNGLVAIPMTRGVESLNVSVAASLVAFQPLLSR